jgi:hypothetical protein
MTIKEALELCDQQIDGKDDEPARIWQDIKATLEAVPVEAIEKLTDYLESEKKDFAASTDCFGGKSFPEHPNHIGKDVIDVEEWLNGNR